MFKPVHCRAARAVLDWSIRDLGNRSGVNFKTVARFENGANLIASTRDAIERALQDAGVRIDHDGSIWHPELGPPQREDRAA
jgi:transcriptional regulator with XRE-family HTH domain